MKRCLASFVFQTELLTVSFSVMSRPIKIEEIERLWDQIASGRDVVGFEDLAKALSGLGNQQATDHLDLIADEYDQVDGITRQQFLATLASLTGDLTSRVSIAFDVFDANGDRKITHDELRDVLLAFGIAEDLTDHFFAAADKDGDGAISFSEFQAATSNAEGRHPLRYRDVHPSLMAPAPTETVTSVQFSKNPQSAPQGKDRRRGEGTSRLQMQIGLFRLLQGAAYRSFRENFAANYETHLAAKTMPYTITEFARYTERAIELYKALGVVEPACFEVLDAVPLSLRQELIKLDDRISTWASIEKSMEMSRAAAEMDAERTDRARTHHVFDALVECALTLRRKNLTVADLSDGALDLHEVKRLRSLDLHQPPPSTKGGQDGDNADYLAAWNGVILETAGEEIDGAMMPNAYWYQEFMPKLLAACSVATADDIVANTMPDEADLDEWFHEARASGEFHPFAEAEMDQFATCEPSQKLMIKQAWRLTRHYLNGIQKRRERLEFGRDSGSLSQYVAFLDVYLGRSDVRDADMRLSFPYFIGPSTWRFLHTTAEIICHRDVEDQPKLIALFKSFFRSFAAMYPCPYCRYHLNRYVVQNREVEYYPLEYLVLGCDQRKNGFEASIDNKLDTISDGPSLRLFLWKLHNAVSSSITRTEPWFHRDERAFYASRYWPSLSEEVACARAFGETEVPINRLSHFSGMLTPVGRLASLRGRWRGMHMMTGSANLAQLVSDAESSVRDLEDALAAGEFLEKTYRFDPSFEDNAPHFTPEEEAYSRSGLFVEA